MHRTRGIRLLFASVVVACSSLPATGPASASAVTSTATESLGIHLERTSIPSLLARPDGSLLALQGRQVRSFGPDGSPDQGLASPRAPAEGRLSPVAAGKTLVLGYKKLTRLNPDGSLDTSFGQGGTIEPGYGAQAVYELGSGKILLVGTETVGPKTFTSSVHVDRLAQDGSRIGGGSFSASVTPTGIGFGATVAVPEIAPTGDGGALVVGSDFLLKVNAEGEVDRGFGEGGVAREASGLVGGHVLPDGSIETVGTAPEEGGGSEDFALSRFTATGKLVTGFGPNGVRRFDLGGNGEDEAEAASWGADGSAIVGGRSWGRGQRPCPSEECEEVPVLAAFDAAGNLETGFAAGGVLDLTALAGLPQGFSGEGVTALARRPDGSIVAAGVAPPNETNGFLAAVTPAGALLSGFGEGGIAREPEPLRARQELSGFVPLPDGGLLAGGTTDVGVRERPVLIRYLPDDTLDRSFGGGAGWVSLFDAPDGSPHGATGFAASGEDVLVGHYDTPFSHLFMARATDGSPVASFGSDGTVDLPSETWANQLAFAADGDPLVLGIHRVSGPNSAEPGVVLRYRPDGTLEDKFGQAGQFTMLLHRKPVRGKSILVGPGERILVGGSLGHRFAFTSLLPDGKPDRRFGSGGWAVVKLGAATHFMTLSQIGKYTYLAGTVGDERAEGDLLLMRFDRHGHLDRGFGRGGRRTVKLTVWGHPVSVLSTPGGPLVVLSAGRKPLVTFGRHGKVSQRRPGAPGEFFSDVRAAISGGRLILGWSTYSRAERATIYHLARRPLGGP